MTPMMQSFTYTYISHVFIINQMANILRKILNFFIILKVYYIYCSFAVIKSWIGMAKQPQMEWARLTFNYFKVKLHECSGSTPLSDGKMMIFANHRSQADFFLHNVITNFQANFLSRMGVLIASPIFIMAYKTVWFFNRNNKSDPEKFNAWLDKKFAQSPRPGFLVYPEGHRMQGVVTVNPDKIKTGMLKYAYRRKIDSQILISFGNEQVFDEKRLHLSWNETVYYKFSEVISPTKFSTEAEYISKVKERFCQIFDEVYHIYTNQKNKA